MQLKEDCSMLADKTSQYDKTTVEDHFQNSKEAVFSSWQCKSVLFTRAVAHARWYCTRVKVGMQEGMMGA